MRGGGARVTKATTTLLKDARQKAKLLRLARLGELGAHSKHPNSASCPRKDFDKKTKNKNKKHAIGY